MGEDVAETGITNDNLAIDKKSLPYNLDFLTHVEYFTQRQFIKPNSLINSNKKKDPLLCDSSRI